MSTDAKLLLAWPYLNDFMTRNFFILMPFCIWRKNKKRQKTYPLHVFWEKPVIHAKTWWPEERKKNWFFFSLFLFIFISEGGKKTWLFPKAGLFFVEPFKIRVTNLLHIIIFYNIKIVLLKSWMGIHFVTAWILNQ